METIKLYNTLTKVKDDFAPIKNGAVGLYTCGPTVYNYAHIGNLRTYIFEDILKRVLVYNGYGVKHVMNITDVGHLTGDMDMGEDKMEAGAKREGKTAWEIAEFYTKAFKEDLQRLNVIEPDIWIKATDTIKEQIELVKILEAKGYTYKTSDGIYFDTAKFKDYTKLSHQKLDELKEGARVEKNEEKRNPTDFALWKFSYPQIPPTPFIKGAKRQMEWESPWGIGFPGWHLECSVMSSLGLGDQLDIHCGGVDHINVHHTNEIAQYEAAYEKRFFNFWLHGAFLNIVGGKKMAKSEGNFLTLASAFINNGIDPLVYRYACLGVHYRKPMEYSTEIMANARSGYEHIKNQTIDLGEEEGMPDGSFIKKFLKVISDDLNMPAALAVTQELLKSSLANKIKLATISDFDRVLGLRLISKIEALPEEVRELAAKRIQAREKKDFTESDRLRGEISKLGYSVEDTREGQRVSKM